MISIPAPDPKNLSTTPYVSLRENTTFLPDFGEHNSPASQNNSIGTKRTNQKPVPPSLPTTHQGNRKAQTQKLFLPRYLGTIHSSGIPACMENPVIVIKKVSACRQFILPGSGHRKTGR
jgi:hypothetical protein